LSAGTSMIPILSFSFLVLFFAMISIFYPETHQVTFHLIRD
jgi:hypothetical protein